MKYLEESLQETCVTWFRYRYPGKIIFHVPNGGRRKLLEAVRLKRQGVTKGVPDIVVLEPSSLRHGLFVELKVGKNKLTKEQVEFMQNLKSRNYEAGVCYSLDEFQKITYEYFGE